MLIMKLAKMTANVENLAVTLYAIGINKPTNSRFGFKQSLKREATTLLLVMSLTPTLTVSEVRTLLTVLVLKLALFLYARLSNSHTSLQLVV